MDELEELARAALLLGRTDQSVDALTRAFHLRLAAGESVGAVRCAFWAAYQFLNRGDIGPGIGWVGRLRTVIESEPPDSVGHAYALAQLAFKQAALDREYAVARDTAVRATSLARERREADMVAMTLTVQGRASMLLGEIRDGVSKLDEAMLEVIGGPVSVPAVGAVYCAVIDACEEIFDFRRAKDWTQALSDWCDRQPGMLAFSGQCLVHRSAIHQLQGNWPQALAEAEEACRRFRDVDTFYSGRGWYRLAEIRRATGDTAGALEAYHKASEFGEDPQPGLGLLWLGQGKGEASLLAVQRALDEVTDPWRRARLLPALIEIALAVGEAETARNGSAALSEVASMSEMPMLLALAASSQGMVKLSEGEARQALAPLRQAQRIWRRLGVPYEEAMVRLLIAKSCRLVGDEQSAQLEEEAARKALAAVGAVFQSKAAAADRHGLSPRELEVLLLLATGLSNQQIADDLYLAVRTVDRHVSNILNKLNVSSRTAAASYAFKHHLIVGG